MFTKPGSVISWQHRWPAWVPAVLVLLASGPVGRAQFDPADLDPFNRNSAIRKEGEKLDPTVALRRELDKARNDAMKNLRKFDPDEVFQRVQRAIQARISAELRKSGAKYDERSGEADLRGTQMGKTLQRWLDEFAQGNKGAGRVDELSFNVKTRQLAVRLYARHSQSWGKIIPGQGPVDLYSVTQRAVFHYDFRKGSGDFDIDLGPLAPHINSRTAKKLQEGDLLGVAEGLVPQGISQQMHRETKDEYANRRQQYRERYGAANVYFASKSFVNWATPETIGRYVLNGVVSGGASVYPEIMHDARKRAQEELPALIAWLKQHGMNEAETAARQLLSGQTPRWPFLKFEMIPVRYSAREKPLNVATTPWRHVDHLAFAIIWSEDARPKPEIRPAQIGGDKAQGSPAEVRTIRVSFTNRTGHPVSFHLNGGKGLSYTLQAGQRQSFRMVVDPGRPPLVSLTRRDGRRHSVTVHDGGAYTFQMERGEIHVLGR